MKNKAKNATLWEEFQNQNIKNITNTGCILL
jgi:hypothetical protein